MNTGIKTHFVSNCWKKKKRSHYSTNKYKINPALLTQILYILIANSFNFDNTIL